MSKPSIRMGVDIGGTFTDVVLEVGPDQHSIKVLTTYLAPEDAIIDGLKANWEDIHEQYQGLSVVTDTTPKKNRKERMEAQMKQLEKDIEMIEKHTVIYIGN